MQATFNWENKWNSCPVLVFIEWNQLICIWQRKDDNKWVEFEWIEQVWALFTEYGIEKVCFGSKFTPLNDNLPLFTPFGIQFTPFDAKLPLYWDNSYFFWEILTTFKQFNPKRFGNLLFFLHNLTPKNENLVLLLFLVSIYSFFVKLNFEKRVYFKYLLKFAPIDKRYSLWNKSYSF